LGSVMVVGHNPTLEHLAWALLDPDDDGRHKLDSGMSTAALAVVSEKVPKWAALDVGSGRLRFLYAPKAR